MSRPSAADAADDARYAPPARWCPLLRRRLEDESLDWRFAEFYVATVAPHREEVAVMAAEDVSGLAGGVDVQALREIREVEDLPVARAVGHEERPVAPVTADVDRRGIAARLRLQAEEPAEDRHAIEDPVGETGVVQRSPPPAGRVGAQLLLEEPDPSRQRRGLEVGAALARRRANVVAPRRSGA